MRQGQNAKRSRGRGRRPQQGGGSGGGGGGNRTLDSNGPEVKIRGTAAQISEKYLALARDANVAGDRVASENYFQHAEHYSRIVAAAQAQNQAQNAARNQQQAENVNPNSNAGNANGEQKTRVNGSDGSSDAVDPLGPDTEQPEGIVAKKGDGDQSAASGTESKKSAPRQRRQSRGNGASQKGTNGASQEVSAETTAKGGKTQEDASDPV